MEQPCYAGVWQPAGPRAEQYSSHDTLAEALEWIAGLQATDSARIGRIDTLEPLTDEEAADLERRGVSLERRRRLGSH